MTRMSPKQRAKQRWWSGVTSLAIELADGRCQAGIVNVCTFRATEGHHKLARSQGGAITLDNCLPVCRSCHDFIGTHPALARRHGFTISRKAAV